MAFVTDSNRPQPLWQPPPTACPTASGAAPEVPSLGTHPWRWPSDFIATTNGTVLPRQRSVLPLHLRDDPLRWIGGGGGSSPWPKGSNLYVSVRHQRAADKKRRDRTTTHTAYGGHRRSINVPSVPRGMRLDNRPLLLQRGKQHRRAHLHDCRRHVHMWVWRWGLGCGPGGWGGGGGGGGWGFGGGGGFRCGGGGGCRSVPRVVLGDLGGPVWVSGELLLWWTCPLVGAGPVWVRIWERGSQPRLPPEHLFPEFYR